MLRLTLSTQIIIMKLCFITRIRTPFLFIIYIYLLVTESEEKRNITCVQLKIENGDFCIDLSVITWQQQHQLQTKKCNLHSYYVATEHQFPEINGAYYKCILSQTHTTKRLVHCHNCHTFSTVFSIQFFWALLMRKKIVLLFVLHITHDLFILNTL